MWKWPSLSSIEMSITYPPKSVWILWFSSLISSCAWSSIWQSAVTRELVQALLNSLKRFLQHVPPAHSSRRQIILQQRKPLREHVSERGTGQMHLEFRLRYEKRPWKYSILMHQEKTTLSTYLQPMPDSVIICPIYHQSRRNMTSNSTVLLST